MKKILISFLLLFLILSFTSSTVSKGVFSKIKEGTILVTAMYNKKGEKTGTIETTYFKIEESDTAMLYHTKQRTLDTKGGEVSKYYSGIYLKDSTFHMSSDFFNTDSTKSFRKGIVSFLEYPLNLSKGSSLKNFNAEYKIESQGGGGVLLNTSFQLKFYDRVFEKLEEIETPLGTFNCYKFVEWAETKSAGITFNRKSVSWFNPEIGIIKSEVYNKKGKLTNTTFLRELK